MKKKLITLVFIMLAITGATAQTIFSQSIERRTSDRPKELKEHRFKKTSGKLNIAISNLVIEGYNGDEVVISTMVELPEESTDPRAAGLQRINRTGLHDNSGGLGLNIREDGMQIEISELGRISGDTVYIKIPNHLPVSVKGGTLWFEGDVTVKNMQGELEILNSTGKVSLKDVTGPVTVQAGGNIEAEFNAPVKGPVSLISSMGFVDAALPLATRANIELSATLGELFAADDFNINIEMPERDTAERPVLAITADSLFGRSVTATRRVGNYGLTNNLWFNSMNRIKGTLNGGGEDIILKTTYGKIYLRKAD